ERSVRIIDSLPELGGQLMALYPEKYLYDVGGFPKILARDLGKSLITQALQFDPQVILNEEVMDLERDGDLIVLRGRQRHYLTRTLLLAGGKGAFEPIRLSCPGYDEFLGKGVRFAIPDREEYRGKRVLLVGGGDSAVDWALTLKDVASELVLIHRRGSFRALERSVARLQTASDAGELSFRDHHEVKEIRGSDGVESVVIFDNQSGEETALQVDAVLTFLGFKPDLGPMKEWGLELEGSRVVVDRLMRTNLPAVFAIGDMVDYEGKLDLIATGFAEAAVAVSEAVKLVDPKARVNPGHSTNLKIFKDS
ncbi:MAG: NAD(P)/FAD-dependent oxidoreductase, partial [Longimicrobiales bacterium]|nr:NAD(P)/FAD-dependent oxidoreductase [Longimicrobiales bacterium]